MKCVSVRFDIALAGDFFFSPSSLVQRRLMISHAAYSNSVASLLLLLSGWNKIKWKIIMNCISSHIECEPSVCCVQCALITWTIALIAVSNFALRRWKQKQKKNEKKNNIHLTFANTIQTKWTGKRNARQAAQRLESATHNCCCYSSAAYAALSVRLPQVTCERTQSTCTANTAQFDETNLKLKLNHTHEKKSIFKWILISLLAFYATVFLDFPRNEIDLAEGTAHIFTIHRCSVHQDNN